MYFYFPSLHLSRAAPFLQGSVLSDTGQATTSTTLRGHIRGPLHLRQIFSLGRNCRKKKQASDEWLQKKEKLPWKNDLQVPILKNKEAEELPHQQDLFRKRDPAGKNLHGHLKGYLQTA